MPIGANFKFDKKVFDKIIEDYMNFVSWKDISSKYDIPQSTIQKYLYKEYDFKKIQHTRRTIDFDNKVKLITDNNSDIKLNKDSSHTLTFEEYKTKGVKGYYWVKCDICGEYTEKTFDSTYNQKNFSCMNCRGGKISQSQRIPYAIIMKQVEDLGCKISLNKKDILKEEEWGRVIDKYWFTCSECNNWFLREYRDFVEGATKCRDCSGTTEWDIDKAKKHIKELGGEMLSDEWVNGDAKYKFKCPKCNNSFKRSFDKAKLGRVFCYSCAKESATKKTRRFTPMEYKKYIKDEFNIECIDDYINGRTPIYHKCPFCGEKWRVSPENLWYKRVTMCTRCSTQCSSRGERAVEDVLKELNLEYLKEFTFKDLGRNRYDFAIINKDNDVKFLIEFDGIQHFEPIEIFGGEEDFKKTKKRDKKKDKYCKDNNIPLLRIPYWDIDNVKTIIEKFIKEENIIEWKKN